MDSILFSLIFILIYPKLSISEPFVVLEYRGGMNKGDVLSDNLFLKDLNYSTNHIVLKNETRQPAPEEEICASEPPA